MMSGKILVFMQSFGPLSTAAFVNAGSRSKPGWIDKVS